MKMRFVLYFCLLLNLVFFMSSCDNDTTEGGAESGQNSSQEKSGSDDSGPEKEGDTEPSGKQIPSTEQTIPGSPVVSNTEQAGEVVNKQKTELGLGEEDNLDIENNTADAYGNAYYQIQQKYKDIPVYGARSVLEIEQGKAVVLSGKFVKELNVNTTPTHPALQALTLALNKIGMTDDLKVKIKDDAELIIFISTINNHLAWLLTVEFENPHIPAEIMIIDAHNPTILARMPLVIQ